jgi:NADH:ubiquinone oxidoreductase subunit 3 (subunit A)
VLAIRTLGAGSIATMLGFLGILSLGWFYAYREGILEWQ